jgi:hypothetical protein
MSHASSSSATGILKDNPLVMVKILKKCPRIISKVLVPPALALSGLDIVYVLTQLPVIKKYAEHFCEAFHVVGLFKVPLDTKCMCMPHGSFCGICGDKDKGNPFCGEVRIFLDVFF